MKLECIKEKVEQALVNSARVTGKNSTLPILSCLLLEAKKNELRIRATNLDLGVEMVVPVKVIEEGVVAVPGAVLTAFITSLPMEKSLKLTLEGGNLSVAGSHNKTLIKAFNHEDFPSIPIVPRERGCRIRSQDLVKGFRTVWYSSAVSTMRPELASVFMNADEDTLVFAATDSFRLAEKRIKAKNLKDFSPTLIPFRNATEMGKILETVPDEVAVHLTKNQIAFVTDSLYLTSRLVDGAFPDYKQIIPKNFGTEAVLLKEDLISALKVANVFGDKFNHMTVRVVPTKKSLEVATKNPDVGENVMRLDAAVSGEALEVSFNYRYIADCLQSVDSDSVTLSFNGPGKPMVLRGVADKSFTYLVMPMNR